MVFFDPASMIGMRYGVGPERRGPFGNGDLAYALRSLRIPRKRNFTPKMRRPILKNRKSDSEKKDRPRAPDSSVRFGRPDGVETRP